MIDRRPAHTCFVGARAVSELGDVAAALARHHLRRHGAKVVAARPLGDAHGERDHNGLPTLRVG